MTKLSFIVPVYNVAPYLRKCVDSLLAQDYDDYEIILVDDGSTDGSSAICDELAGKPTSGSSLKGREEGTHDSFASVWGAHTADRTQYDILKGNAIANRKNPTEAEDALWKILKANNLGMHFRRQHVILDYIVDFICLEKGLVIELDGGYHNHSEQVEYDKQRTAHLQQLGYTELRFTNEELLCGPESVIARIKEVASSLPSFQGRGGVRPPIRVIHQSNAGLSAARNTGIAAAQGEYLCFVDSDDYWEPNVLSELMAQIGRNKLDVLRFKYQYVRKVERVNEFTSESEYEVFNPYKSDPYAGNDYSEEITDGVTFLNTRMNTQCYAWAFILRRDLILGDKASFHHSINPSLPTVLFTEGIYFEDVDWTPRMLVKARRVAATDTKVYNYLMRQGSITNAVNRAKQQKVLDDKMRLVEEMLRQAMTLREQGHSDVWFRRMIADSIISIIGILSTQFYATRKPYLFRLKGMDIWPIYTGNHQSPITNLKTWLINLSPRLAVELLHWRNAK